MLRRREGIEMEQDCAFFSFGECSGDQIPLQECTRDISRHLGTLGISRNDIPDEIELLLCRGGFFCVDRQDVPSRNVCRFHRNQLGIYWRGRRQNCQVPPVIAGHKGEGVRGEKDCSLSRSHSRYIFDVTGILIPVGSAVCRECRRRFTQQHQGAEIQELYHDTLERMSKLRCNEALQDISTISLTPKQQDVSWRAEWVDGNTDEDSDDETVTFKDHQDKKLTAINELLHLEGCQPLSRTLQVPWQDASRKTQKFYRSKAEEVVTTVLEVIAPNDAGLLWNELKESPRINKRYNEHCTTDTSLMLALVESYKQASSNSMRKNILSVIANKLSFNDLEKLIPGISRHRFTTARRHGLQYGADALATQIGTTSKAVRQKVDPEQVEHFISFITGQNAIQDLPFGLRKLRLTTGEEIEIPNVIRLLIPSRLVEQYLQFCRETNFQPLGRSTLLKIISESCSASVRKCMRGLDNYLAEGTSAIDDLTYVVDKLSQEGMCDEKAADLKNALIESKQYLKGDYKVHATTESDIPDHCIKYSLSDKKERKYQDPCDHDHNQACDRCLQLKNVLDSVVDEVNATTFENKDDKDECIFLSNKAKSAILAWKAHQLRCINQDRARLDVLQSLDSTTVLIVQDFAMKFMPSRYREAQSEFFGKRGISWHVSVCHTKVDGRLKSQTFIHIMESGIQESNTIVLIMEHVLRSLKEQHPQIVRAFFRQDNGGCYHSGNTILSAEIISKRSGIFVSRIDFSDPQGGKGACDRKAAQIKAHVKSYINEGNSVTNARELKQAIESRGGIPGVSVAVVQVRNNAPGNFKLKGISSLNNFLYTKKGFTAFRAYNIGSGKDYEWNTFTSVPKTTDFAWFDEELFQPASFVEVFQRAAKVMNVHPETNEGEDSEEDRESQTSTSASGSGGEQAEAPQEFSRRIYNCPDESCTKTFVRYSALERHCEFGAHKRSLEKITLQDRAKISYAKHLQESQCIPHPSINRPSAIPDELGNSECPQGWALKTSSTKPRFSKKQKDFLNSKYNSGEETGKKANSEDVAKEMRKVRGKNGKRMFAVEEFLTAQQIASYFSRVTAKRRNLVVSDCQEQEHADVLREVSQEVTSQLQQECPSTSSCAQAEPEVPAPRQKSRYGRILRRRVHK